MLIVGFGPNKVVGLLNILFIIWPMFWQTFLLILWIIRVVFGGLLRRVLLHVQVWLGVLVWRVWYRLLLFLVKPVVVCDYFFGLRKLGLIFREDVNLYIPGMSETFLRTLLNLSHSSGFTIIEVYIWRYVTSLIFLVKVVQVHFFIFLFFRHLVCRRRWWFSCPDRHWCLIDIQHFIIGFCHKVNNGLKLLLCGLHLQVV